MSDELFKQVMQKLAIEISDHNTIYDKDDDHYYIKDDKCTCDYCIAYRVLFLIRYEIVKENNAKLGI